MPIAVTINGRLSSLTNAFINAIIPVVEPTEEEVKHALEILGMTPENLRCAYCGDKSTEWDHLRPLVLDRRPTGYISEIHNLVPACGKCNQSKRNQDWRVWMHGTAPQSPASRKIPDLEERVRRLSQYELWNPPSPLALKELIGEELWQTHWQNWEDLRCAMVACQAHAEKIAARVREKHQNARRNAE